MERAANPDLSLADLAEAHRDALIDRSIARALAATEGPYTAMTPAQLRPLITAGMDAVIKDLAEDEPRHFGQYFASIVDTRVRQGFTVKDMQEAINVAQDALRGFFHDEIGDPVERLKAVERGHTIIDATRVALFNAFVRAHEAILREQFELVKQLISPIMPIYSGVLLLPLVGAVDASRADEIMEILLRGVAGERADVVIIDVTGVPSLDAGVASSLIQATRAARLLGASVVVVGVSPALALVMLQGGIDLTGVVTRANLQAGLEHALELRGLVIQSGRAAAGPGAAAPVRR